jgi:predicted ArsR family transcriptional regulator
MQAIKACVAEVQAVDPPETAIQTKLIDLLGAHGPMTRGDIVYSLQIARTTIYDHLDALITRNVVETMPKPGPRGRPQVLFSLRDGVIV